MINYLSVCSGIEAFSVAVADMPDWTPVAFSEIEAFPSLVLKHHWPSVPNLGDFTQIDAAQLPRVDWLVAGTPCQAFSIAGLRQSLEDDRGNLTLAFVRLAHALAETNGLRGLLWENVPGCLSTKDNAFGCFVGALVGHDGPLYVPGGGSWPSVGMVAGPRARIAWRVLDSQHFGVPQRRKRIFLVADFGNGPDPAAVLFEPRGKKRSAKPRRKEGQEVAGTLGGSSQGGGFRTTDLDNSGAFVVAAYLGNAEGGNAEGGNAEGGNAELPGAVTKSNVGKHINNQSPLVAVFDPLQVTSKANRSRPTPELAHTLPASATAPVVYALQAGTVRENPNSGPDGVGVQENIAYTLEARPEVQFVVETAPTLRAGGNMTGGHRPPGSDVDTAETLVVYSTMPMNSGKDFKARETDIAQPLMTKGSPIGNQGGDLVVAFSSKDHGQDAGELSPTLRAAGHTGSHANGGAPPAVTAGMQVRRLSPRECERLQGFPDWQKVVSIQVCADAKPEAAKSVKKNSPAPRPGSNAHAAVRVQIDLEGRQVEIRNQEKLLWSVSTAEQSGSFHPLVPIGDFAQLAALIVTIAERITRDGKAALPPPEMPFTHRLSGENPVLLYGQEIAALASDAKTFTSALRQCITFTTSGLTQNSRTSARTLEILCCFVVSAIASFIPEQTPGASSCLIEVATIQGHTLIPGLSGWRDVGDDEDVTALEAAGLTIKRTKNSNRLRVNDPDGPRYKSLGNSFTVKTVKWIMRRVNSSLAGLPVE